LALSPKSTADEIISHLRSLGSAENRAGMARYGIRVDRALGVSHGVQRDIARKIGRDHPRAMQLWDTGIAEGRFLAGLTADPAAMTVDDARRWASDFDSWDIVDGTASFFSSMADWQAMIAEFAADEREFVRRTAFAMICWAAVHRKTEPDATFAAYLPLIRTYATDERNFVRKAVNWALRTIGKRSWALYPPALATAEDLAASTNPTARWIGRNAAHELWAEKTLAMLERRLGPRPKS